MSNGREIIPDEILLIKPRPKMDKFRGIFVAFILKNARITEIHSYLVKLGYSCTKEQVAYYLKKRPITEEERVKVLREISNRMGEMSDPYNSNNIILSENLKQGKKQGA